MGCGSSALNAEATQFTIPQADSEDLRKKREQEIVEQKEKYALVQHPGRDLPPWVNSVPLREEMTAKGVWELTKVFYRLWDEKIQARMNMLGERITNCKNLDQPFERFRAVFDTEEIPKVASVWETDEEFGYQHLNGLMPHFIAKVNTMPENFKVTDEMVKNLLPEGKTLAELAAAGRIFLADVCETLEGVKPVRDNVMPAPMALFVIDDQKRLMPLAITLDRHGGPVYTPNDAPGLWLGVKIHEMCAEFQVHTLLVHALTEHMMMEPIWATLNQTMSARHPLHAVLAPHMWNMVFVNTGVRDSLMADADASGAKGSLQNNLQAGKDGSVEITKKMYVGLDWNDYFNIPLRYKKLGIMDIPNYYYRDDSLELWHAIFEYTTDLAKAIYPKAEEIAKDNELQDWAKAMKDPNVGDIRGLPLGKDGAFETHEHVAMVLTMVIYQCAVRHSHVENAAQEYYPWVPAYPASYRLPIPTTRDDIPRKTIDEHLPDQGRTIAQIALIESVKVKHDEVPQFSVFPKNFLSTAPTGCHNANEKFVKKLNDIEARMIKDLDARAGKNPVRDAFMLPSHMAASIWN
jgi:hypothetical protein